MATFALIHDTGDVGWYWHLLEAELLERGHDVVAPDLPSEDDAAGLAEYADAGVDAIGDRLADRLEAYLAEPACPYGQARPHPPHPQTSGGWHGTTAARYATA